MLYFWHKDVTTLYASKHATADIKHFLPLCYTL